MCDLEPRHTSVWFIFSISYLVNYINHIFRQQWICSGVFINCVLLIFRYYYVCIMCVCGWRNGLAIILPLTQASVYLWCFLLPQHFVFFVQKLLQLLLLCHRRLVYIFILTNYLFLSISTIFYKIVVDQIHLLQLLPTHYHMWTPQILFVFIPNLFLFHHNPPLFCFHTTTETILFLIKMKTFHPRSRMKLPSFFSPYFFYNFILVQIGVIICKTHKVNILLT